jgi:hypothetical protein
VLRVGRQAHVIHALNDKLARAGGLLERRSEDDELKAARRG